MGPHKCQGTAEQGPDTRCHKQSSGTIGTLTRCIHFIPEGCDPSVCLGSTREEHTGHQTARALQSSSSWPAGL